MSGFDRSRSSWVLNTAAVSVKLQRIFMRGRDASGQSSLNSGKTRGLTDMPRRRLGDLQTTHSPLRCWQTASCRSEVWASFRPFKDTNGVVESEYLTTHEL
jgi:hypothetical protein